MPPICTIRGTLIRADGVPVAGQHVLATIRSTLVDQGGQVAGTPPMGITSETIEAYTDALGAFRIDLLQNAVFEIEIPAINLRKEILVPELSDVDFIELI